MDAFTRRHTAHISAQRFTQGRSPGGQGVSWADAGSRDGAEWRESGCSMCIAMNEDRLSPGEYAVSTSNRNFEGRQGPGGRTFLASPLTASAAAVTGVITDARTLL